MTWLRSILVGIAALSLASCGGMTVADFADRKPELKLEEYFAGRLKAWGVFVDRFGRLRREFVVDLNGTWDEARQTLTLEEDFVYSDGEKERRVWTIRKLGPGRYEGSADGVVGVAAGASAGNAVFWTYMFDLKVGDGTWRVRFDDWLWRQDREVVFNRAVISKWGFELGQVSIFFRKPAP